MGKKYNSFKKMVEELSQTDHLKNSVKKEIENRSLAKLLFSLRCEKNFTQQEMADKVGCTQSKISKIEGSYDEDLTIKDLLNYARALNLQLDLGYSDPNMSIVEQIKFHVFEIKRNLERLREFIKGDPGIANGIISFHEEALFNFMKFFADSLTKIKFNLKSEKKAQGLIQISQSLGRDAQLTNENVSGVESGRDFCECSKGV